MFSVSVKNKFFLYRLSLIVVLLASVLALTLLVEAGRTGEFDAFLIGIVQHNKSRTMQILMEMVTLTGTVYGVILILAGVSIWLWRRRALPSLKEFLGISLFSFITEVAAKVLVHRARPSSWLGITEPGYSFPSGHSIMTFVIAVELIIILRRLGLARWCAVAALLCIAAAVGVSRIYLGVHWPTDVLGSWLMGSVIITACALLPLENKGKK